MGLDGVVKMRTLGCGETLWSDNDINDLTASLGKGQRNGCILAGRLLFLLENCVPFKDWGMETNPLS